MISYNPEFQTMLSLAFGVTLGVFSVSLFATIVFVLFFEYMVLYMTISEKEDDHNIAVRIFINVVFLFGWVFSKVLLTRNTGFEDFCDGLEMCYETFPN